MGLERNDEEGYLTAFVDACRHSGRDRQVGRGTNRHRVIQEKTDKQAREASINTLE